MEATRQESTREYTHLIPPRTYMYLITRHSVSQMEDNMMRHRAILTGTIQRATYYNKPLPRMKLQPLHVTGMISKRIRARERRRVQHWTLMSLTKHMEAEAKFERALKKNAARFGQNFKSVFQHMDWGKYCPPPSTGCGNHGCD